MRSAENLELLMPGLISTLLKGLDENHDILNGKIFNLGVYLCF